MASIDGRNYLVIDTTIYSTDLSCLFGIPQLQPFSSAILKVLQIKFPSFVYVQEKMALIVRIIAENKKKQLKVAGGDNLRRHGNERE